MLSRYLTLVESVFSASLVSRPPGFGRQLNVIPSEQNKMFGVDFEGLAGHWRQKYF